MTKQMTKWQIEEWIRDYNFMHREIARLNRILNKVSYDGGTRLVARYGIEATLPKGSSGISQAEIKQLDSREKRLYKYEEIIFFLESANTFFKTEKYRVVYECMLEGMSYRAIAKHLGVSRDTIREIKEQILDIIYQEGQKDQIPQLLKYEKTLV
nr:helix-turn-helix domain-containing protein [Heyndrickxia oleronia]